MSLIEEIQPDSYSYSDTSCNLLNQAFQESSENINSFIFYGDSYIIDILPHQDGEVSFLDTSFDISLNSTLLSAFEGISINMFDNSLDFLENEISLSNSDELAEDLL